MPGAVIFAVLSLDRIELEISRRRTFALILLVTASVILVWLALPRRRRLH